MCVGLGCSSEYITEHWANLALLFISNERFTFTQQCSAAGAPLLRLWLVGMAWVYSHSVAADVSATMATLHPREHNRPTRWQLPLASFTVHHSSHAAFTSYRGASQA